MFVPSVPRNSSIDRAPPRLNNRGLHCFREFTPRSLKTDPKCCLLSKERNSNAVITQLSIPTHAQIQRHRLKFIKNHLKKTPTCFGLRPSSGSYNFLAKITIIIDHTSKIRLLTTVGCFYAKSGDVAACRVVCIGLYSKSA